MKSHPPTQFPLGYDERTTMSLTPNNDIVIAHPLMPPMIYDETVMRWVHLGNEPVQQETTNEH